MMGWFVQICLFFIFKISLKQRRSNLLLTTNYLKRFKAHCLQAHAFLTHVFHIQAFHNKFMNEKNMRWWASGYGLLKSGNPAITFLISMYLIYSKSQQTNCLIFRVIKSKNPWKQIQLCSMFIFNFVEYSIIQDLYYQIQL